MATSSASTRNAGLISSAAFDFIRRRMREILGTVLIVAAVLGLATVISYAPSDRSFNSATGAAPQNWLGGFGAIFAARLWLYGWFAFFVPMVLAGWGWRLARYHVLERLAIRFGAALITMHCGSLVLSAVAPAAQRAGDIGPGGVIGAVLAHYGAATSAAVMLPFWPVVVAAALLTALCAPLAIGVPWQDWRAVAVALVRGAHRAAVGIRVALRWTTRTFILGDGNDAPPLRTREPSIRERSNAIARQSTPVEVAAPAPTPRVAVAAKETAHKPRPRQDRRRSRRTDDAQLPPVDLLATPHDPSYDSVDQRGLEQNARALETVLDDFGVRGQIAGVRNGPVVTRYELEPAPGTRSSRVIALADDIARSMSAISARVAVVPGKNVIGIELPNVNRDTVFLRELLLSDEYDRPSTVLPLALGKDISGAPVVADLARMPHLLVAGTTGSGKSVAINSMILSLVYRLRPDACKFIMIDPKMLELSVYDGIPHLLHPVVTDPNKAVVALKWAVKEMNRRYRLMSNLNVRNIAGYNKRLAQAIARNETLTRTVQTGFDGETGKPVYEDQPIDMVPIPQLVVVVDEMADLMLVAGKDIEVAVQSLAQKARAAGIHLIIATQRPSVDVITGTIKANLPTRISFQVTSKIDSRTILGEQGAEQLLGMGDMLFMAGGGQVTRVHGPFVSEDEVEEVASFLRGQGEPDYLDAVTDDADELAEEAGSGAARSGDALYDRALDLISRERKASTSFIQRHLQIGYNRAARIIEQMEAEGVVSKANHVGKREVLVPEPGDRY